MMLIAFYILHLTYFPWPSAEAIWTRPVKKTSGRDELSGFANPENERESTPRLTRPRNTRHAYSITVTDSNTKRF